MTQDYLEEFLARGREIHVKSMEIKQLYDTRRSVPIDSLSRQRHPFGLSSVEKALHKIDKIAESLEKDVIAYADGLETIETWLKDCVKNPEICAVIRSRYILGKTWQQTSWIVYRSQAPSTSHKSFTRFISKNQIFEEQSI